MQNGKTIHSAFWLHTKLQALDACMAYIYVTYHKWNNSLTKLSSTFLLTLAALLHILVTPSSLEFHFPVGKLHFPEIFNWNQIRWNVYRAETVHPLVHFFSEITSDFVEVVDMST